MYWKRTDSSKFQYSVLILVITLSLMVFSTSVSAANINAWVNPNTQTVSTGNTATTTLNIKNQGSVWSMTCSKIDVYLGNDFQYSETINIQVSATDTKTKSEIIQTPSSGSGTLSVKFKVYCKTALDGEPTQQFSDIFSVSYSPPAVSFSLTRSKPSVNLLVGQSETITITLSNTMSSGSLSCTKGASSIGTITAGGSTTFNHIVQAPSSGSGTTSSIVSVTCVSDKGASASQSTDITINYQQDPCKAALSDARNAITDAQTAITSAQSKIQEANQLGADVTNAQTSLNNANSQLSSAQTSLATAQSTCDSGDKTTGSSQANGAKTSAAQSKTYATDALNSAQQSITTFTQKKIEASNKISDANSAIDTTTIAVNKDEGALNNATQLSSVLPEAVQGVDLATEKANVNTARLKIDQAKNYIKEGQTAFDQKNFDLAKSKATSAIDLSSEANKLSTESYTRINAVLLTLGEAGKAVLSATNEISQTDEILSKMNYVIKNVENYGVNLGEAKEIASTGQSNIDTAKDLLSQARNRLQAGVSTDAVNKAITARDKAAEPTNRLNRIVDSISTQTQDALKKAYADAEQKITDAENSVNSAAGTFGATQSEVLAAQDSLAKAKSQLTNASSAVNDASSAEDLPTFLSKASLAFAALEDVNLQAKSAESHASSAKMGLITKIVIPVAGAAGAAGGGFLFWRLRRKKKLSIGKVEKTIEKDIGKIWKMFCTTCNKEYSQFEKFCSVCGKKLRKLTVAKHKQRR